MRFIPLHAANEIQIGHGLIASLGSRDVRTRLLVYPKVYPVYLRVTELKYDTHGR